MEHEVDGCIKELAKLVSMRIDEKNNRYEELMRTNKIHQASDHF